jgi:hypothetical protein
VARKPKAKRRGRPSLPKGERREVLPVRLPSALIARAKAYGAPAEVVEKALTAWLDQWEGRAHEILACAGRMKK